MHDKEKIHTTGDQDQAPVPILIMTNRLFSRQIIKKLSIGNEIEIGIEIMTVTNKVSTEIINVIRIGEVRARHLAVANVVAAQKPENQQKVLQMAHSQPQAVPTETSTTIRKTH